MLRSIAGKVVWVGRTAATVLGLALVLALVFGVATTAIGATGGNFILGKANAAGTPSSLTASIAKPTLTLINKSTDAAATALNISVASGKAPLKVNAAAGTATNLSADKLDGMDSGAFFRGREIVQQSATARPNSQDYYSSTRVTATCPSGKSALGGGYYVGNVSDAVVVAHSMPTSDGGGWEIYVHNETPYDVSVTVYAVCAVASS